MMTKLIGGMPALQLQGFFIKTSLFELLKYHFSTFIDIFIFVFFIETTETFPKGVPIFQNLSFKLLWSPCQQNQSLVLLSPVALHNIIMIKKTRAVKQFTRTQKVQVAYEVIKISENQDKNTQTVMRELQFNERQQFTISHIITGIFSNSYEEDKRWVNNLPQRNQFVQKRKQLLVDYRKRLRRKALDDYFRKIRNRQLKKARKREKRLQKKQEKKKEKKPRLRDKGVSPINNIGDNSVEGLGLSELFEGNDTTQPQKNSELEKVISELKNEIKGFKEKEQQQLRHQEEELTALKKREQQLRHREEEFGKKERLFQQRQAEELADLKKREQQLRHREAALLERESLGQRQAVALPALGPPQSVPMFHDAIQRASSMATFFEDIMKFHRAE